MFAVEKTGGEQSWCAACSSFALRNETDAIRDRCRRRVPDEGIYHEAVFAP